MSIARGIKVPDVIDKGPDLAFGLEIFITAFWEMSTERLYQDGYPLSISRSVIREWLIENEIDDNELRITMFHHIRELDTVYLEDAINRLKTDRAPSGKREQTKPKNTGFRGGPTRKRERR